MVAACLGAARYFNRPKINHQNDGVYRTAYLTPERLGPQGGADSRFHCVCVCSCVCVCVCVCLPPWVVGRSWATHSVGPLWRSTLATHPGDPACDPPWRPSSLTRSGGTRGVRRVARVGRRGRVSQGWVARVEVGGSVSLLRPAPVTPSSLRAAAIHTVKPLDLRAPRP